MPVIAKCIYNAATDIENQKEEIKADVAALLKIYPLYE